MQECGGAASAGGLSFSDNGGDDDTLPSLSLPLDSMAAAAAAAAEKSFYSGASWGLGA